ncbi:MAG: M23 family metallopeptidase, partial [Crocinitomicaceae bacterium]
SNCITDDDGLLHCRVPDELLEGNKLNINVGFAQFAVTREIFEGEDKSSTTNRPIKRPTKVSETGPTKFMAHWVGDPGEDSSPNPNEQNLDWEKQITEDKNFGWKITEDSGMIEGTEKSLVNQLRVAIPLEVKTVNSKDYEFLKMVYPDIHELGYRTDHFSTFFKENNIHFTLYGMQWCQPIWDEYDPQEILNGKLKHTFIQDKKVVHPHMHVVTLAPYLQGKFNKYTDKTKEEYYSGKGYGKFENYHAPKSVWRGGDGHQGYDIHAVIGANVFAFHCGKISLNPSNGAAGKYLKVSWEKHNDANEDEYTAISYGHLNEFLKKAKDYVIAGEKVAKGGRTGNIDKVPIRDKKTNKITGYKKIKSLYPSHVHVNAGSTTKKDMRYYPHLRKTMDVYFPENALTMPSNFSPLLFPCHGEVASSNVKVQPKNCDLKNEHVVNMCWAAGELKCPYIKTDSRKSTESVLQLQIQLRYLNEKPATVEKNDLDVKYLIKSEESSEYEKHLVDLSAFLAEDKNTNYFHFGLVNGTIGSTITPITDSDIASGTKLTRARSSSVYNNSTHALEKVRYTNSEGATKTTWIEKAYIDSSYHTTERIQNLPSSQPSKTQMAIYCFRKQHELLKTDNYYQNFETDDEFWEELNTQCGF